MKKSLYTLAIMITLSFVGCKKYEDGPRISFRSIDKRLEHGWKIEKLLINGTDKTSTISSDYTETYASSGDYSFSGTSSGSGSGKWVFENNKDGIKRSGVSKQPTYDLVILRLKMSKFWYYYINGSDKYEYHFVKQ